MIRAFTRLGRSTRIAVGAAGLVVGAVALPASAALETVDQGTWGGASSTWSCGHGATISSPYSCTYTTSAPTWSEKCTEAGANTGGGATASVNCDIEVTVTTQVAPIFNAAGKVVGCTSVAATASGQAAYTSGTGFWSATIPISTADIHGANTDGVNGAGNLAYHGHIFDGTFYDYSVSGVIAAAQCARNSSGFSSTGAGNVTVAAGGPQ